MLVMVNEFGYYLYSIFSEPSNVNDFDVRFQPIENDQMHYIELNNDGPKGQVNPHKESINFWVNLEQKAIQMSRHIEPELRDEL